MPTDFAFRLSTYLTLFLGCICLGYAEWDYLPEVTGFTALVGILVALAFWVDRKGLELSLESANRVGFVLGLISLGWLGWHYRQPDSLMHVLPWPAGGLPFVGPILMLLIVAKLFRPKHVRDWWALQGVGLASVALASALCDDELIVLLAAIYILAGVWSLTLFFIRRASGYVDPVPPHTHLLARMVRGILSVIYPSLAVVRPPHRPTVAIPFAGVGKPTPTERLGRSHFTRAIRWLAVASAVAFPLFLITPRSRGLQWELFKSKMETGLTSENSVDMGRTGELKANHEIAFEVTAHWPDGAPRDDLSPNQRWRVSSFAEYLYPKGRWTRGAKLRLYSPPDRMPLSASRPPTDEPQWPDLGISSFLLDFKLTRKVPGLALYDPVVFRPGQPAPVVYRNNLGYSNAVQEHDTSLMTYRREGGRLTEYTQLAVNGSDLNGPFPEYFELEGLNPAITREMRLRSLLRIDSEAIRRWTRELVDRLVTSGKLPARVRANRNPYTLNPADEDHEIVARALCEYLSRSEDFKYSLNLRRTDRAIDPIEDFLFKTRAGHCERFAAALVLMLRSTGIPAQFVLGFKGCESQGQGRYIVRQEHAHAWVECLIWKPSSAPAPWRGARDWYWLSLDPTPDSGNDEISGDDSLFEVSRKQGRRLVAELIVGLNPETQKKIASAATDAASSYGPKMLLGILIVTLPGLGWWTLTRWQRSRVASIAQNDDDLVPWYAEMVHILTTKGLPPESGQTPHEYALKLQATLTQDPQQARAALAAQTLVRLLYQSRYAGVILSEEQRATIAECLDQLRSGLDRIPNSEKTS